MTYVVHPKCRTAGKDGRHRAIIVDLDGTLALKREGEGERGYFDWHRVGEDNANDVVVSLIWRYAGDHCILMVTGRSAVCREETLDWLEHHDIPYCALYMRPDDEAHRFTTDAAIKRTIWETELARHFAVSFVLEDRDQAVALWRELGLQCWQVAPGNF